VALVATALLLQTYCIKLHISSCYPNSNFTIGSRCETERDLIGAKASQLLKRQKSSSTALEIEWNSPSLRNALENMGIWKRWGVVLAFYTLWQQLIFGTR